MTFGGPQPAEARSLLLLPAGPAAKSRGVQGDRVWNLRRGRLLMATEVNRQGAQQVAKIWLKSRYAVGSGIMPVPPTALVASTTYDPDGRVAQAQRSSN